MKEQVSVGMDVGVGLGRFEVHKAWGSPESRTMLADERKLRKAKSVIQHHPTAVRNPKIFLYEGLLQPIKYNADSRAYYYSDQSSFPASRKA